MTTTRYKIPYNVAAHTRLEALLEAGKLLRTAVRVTGDFTAEQVVPGRWIVRFDVEEDLPPVAEPPEPKWLHEDRHIGEGLSDPDCRECERGWETWNLVGAW